uniref:hypothetical protein n=1 Tax=Alistipes shahii TaxID=328814 RepID=UPI0040387F50
EIKNGIDRTHLNSIEYFRAASSGAAFFAATAGCFCIFLLQKVVKPRSSPAGHSYLLMAKGSTKTIRMSFSAGVFSGPR